MTITKQLELAEFKTFNGDYEGALFEYDELVSMAKHDPLSYECRAHFKSNYLKDYEGAIEDYNRSIDLYPNENTIVSRAELKIKIDDLKGATQDFLKVLDLNPENELKIKVLRKLADIATVNRNFTSAIVCYNKVIQLDSKNFQVLLARASLLYNTNNIKDAIKDWEKVVDLQPDNKIAIENLQTAINY